jgi:hypothetical protein
MTLQNRHLVYMVETDDRGRFRSVAPTDVMYASDLEDLLGASLDQYGDSLRADSAAPAIEAGRAITRRVLGRAAERGAELPMSLDHLGAKLGYSRRQGVGTEHKLVRADAYYLEQDRLGTGTTDIEQNPERRELQATLPLQAIEPWANEYEDEYIEGTGSVIVGSGRENQIPEVDAAIRSIRHPMVWLLTSTRIAWSDRDGFSRSRMDVAAKKTQQAYTALDEAYGRLLRQGAPGVGVQSLDTLPMPETTLDLSGSLTLEQLIERIAQSLEDGRAASGYQGPMHDSILIHERILARYRTRSSIVGNSTSGLIELVRKLAEYGITRVIPTTQTPDSRLGSDYLTAITFLSGRLTRPVGVAPAPVSVAEHHGTHTIFGMKVGGVGLVRSVDANLHNAKVV